MIRCNGSSSAGRDTHANETPAGSIGPSAQRGRDCCAVFVSIGQNVLAELQALPDHHDEEQPK
jgi:hypothetical protein